MDCIQTTNKANPLLARIHRTPLLPQDQYVESMPIRVSDICVKDLNLDCEDHCMYMFPLGRPPSSFSNSLGDISDTGESAD